MDYVIQIGNDIHTSDIDAYYPMPGFELYEAKDWEKVREKSTFIVQILDSDIGTTFCHKGFFNLFDTLFIAFWKQPGCS